jgi:hypothetical protein
MWIKLWQIGDLTKEWLLAFGCWLLAVGIWLLAVGYWLLAKAAT